MKRFLIIVTVLVLTLSISGLAQEYTLEDLLEKADTDSASITNKQKELDTVKCDLQILQTTYHPKVSLSTKPFGVSPDVRTEEFDLDFSSSGSLAATLKLPWGLDLSGSVSLSEWYADTRDMNYALSMQYNIYPGQLTDSTRLQMDAKKRNLEKIGLEIQAKRLEVQIQVREKFYSTLILQERVKFSEASLNEAAADYALYQNLLARGDVSKRDLLEKEIAFKASQVSFERSQQQYFNSMKELISFVGIRVELTKINEIKLAGSLTVLEQIPMVKPEEETLSFDRLAQDALANSLTVRDAMVNLQVAEEDLQRMQNRPEIKTAFEYKPVANSKEEEYNWALSLTANYQLSDGGKLSLERQKQQKTIADLKKSLEDVKAQVYDQLQTQLTGLKIAYLDYLGAELELQRAVLDQENKVSQYAKGLISDSQLVAGERSVAVKELDYLQKRLSYQVSYWGLWKFVYLNLNIDEVRS